MKSVLFAQSIHDFQTKTLLKILWMLPTWLQMFSKIYLNSLVHIRKFISFTWLLPSVFLKNLIPPSPVASTDQNSGSLTANEPSNSNQNRWTRQHRVCLHAPKSTSIKISLHNSFNFLFISIYLIIFVRFLWFVLFSIFTVKNGNPAQFSSNWGGQKILTSGWLPVTFRLVYGEFHKMSHSWVIEMSHI